MKYTIQLIVAGLCLLATPLQAQLTITGQLTDALTNDPIEGGKIFIEGTSKEVKTDRRGFFELEDIRKQNPIVIIQADGHQDERIPLDATSGLVELGMIEMDPTDNLSSVNAEDLIPTISLSVSDLEDESSGPQNISGLLTASRDVFINAAAFQFGPRRFRLRGYNSDHTMVFINNIPMNSIEIGRPFWGSWGGLNDVLRGRSISVGLENTSYAFGGVGGSTAIDARPSTQRKQFRVSYASSNRSYRHRVMATYSTGMQQNGWAFSLSGSMRYAGEGYNPGTFYNAYSYFAAAEKKLSKAHSLSFTIMGAPNRRGRSVAATDEWYDLAGTNYYNPWWGYQNGEKRNARIADVHQPIGILSHEWKINDNARLTTSASFKFGQNGSTALDWYDAPDPRPEYYRYAPSYVRLVNGDEQADILEEIYRNNEAARQIDWQAMYDFNRGTIDRIENVGGIEGNDVEGYRSNYIVEERRYDSDEFNFNTVYENNLTDNFTLQSGLMYQYYNGKNFKIVEDLLGGDFYVDIDRFAEFDAGGDQDFIQNDLDNPNRIVREGDRWGYDYESNIHRAAVWGQGNWTFRKVDAFAAVELSNTRFWRTGNLRNGRFPDNSLGDSEEQTFTNFSVKGGLTYKLDGRNYFFANAGYLTRAPFFRNAYVSPRFRDQVVPGLTDQKITSFEGGYLLRSPYAKARVVGYYTTFEDQLFNRSLFLDNALQDGTLGGFVNYIMTGLDVRHMGIELGLDVQLMAGLNLVAAAAIGEYIYTSRPDVSVYLDNRPEDVLFEKEVYIENFYVPGTPQQAYTIGLNYRSPKYWFLNVNFNYLNRVYMDFFPERRTLEAVSIRPVPEFQTDILDPESQLFRDIIEQDSRRGGFTVDLFGGKSFKIDDTFIYLTVGVSNLLDDQNFVTGGFEQFRFDFEGKELGQFPNRYFYAWGINYFAQIAFRF